MANKFVETTVLGGGDQAIELIGNILESSVGYSIIGEDLDGKIVLWNEGARRAYGYEAEDVVGKADSALLHTPEDVVSGKPRQMMDAALRDGKWEGTINRLKRNGERFTARVVITARRDASGRPSGFLLISKDISDEIRLAEELKAVQFYTRSLIESDIDALMTSDPLGVITDVNRQMEVLTGYSREELIGTPFKRFFTDPSRSEEGIMLVLRNGRVTNYELTALSKNGRMTVVSYNASTFCDRDGKLQGVFASARDISEQKTLEQQLRDQQSYLRGLVDSSVDGLITVDLSGTITDVNDRICQMSEYARSALIGSRFADYFDNPEQARAGVQQTLDAGLVAEYALVLVSRTGRQMQVFFNASVFKDPSGKVRGILASARDNSEQARLQTQLAEQQAYNRSLIEASADALFVIAPDGVITDVNEEATRLSGYTRSHLINSRFSEYFTAPASADAGVQKTLAESRVIAYELVLITRQGPRIAVSFTAGVFGNSKGSPVGILAGARDTTGQKNLEQELRNQQFYTRSLIESNIDALMTTNPLGVITDVNHQMELLTGCTRDQLIGTPFKNCFTDRERAEDGIRLVLSQGKVTNYELTARAQNGRETVVSYNAATFYDRDGTLQGVFAAARNITELKEAEEALRKAGALQSAIFNSANFSSIATDAKGVIQIFNVGAERMLGYTAAEVMNKITPAEISDPQELVARARALSAELETSITPGFEALVFKASRGIEDIYELTYIRKDGSRFPAVVSVTALRDVQEDIIGYLLIGTDNAARHQVEEERKKLDQRLRDQQFYTRSLIESNIDALMTTNPLGVITDVNHQMELLTGCTRDQLIGTPFKNCFTDRERAEDGIRLVLSQGNVTNYELTARAQNGRETVVSYNAATFYDRNGTLQGVFAAARDVTERKLFEQTLQEKNVELENANFAKDRFLASMSHELRTPLNAIIGYTGTLLMKLPGPLNEEQGAQLRTIQSSGKHLLSLINDLLDLAKIESGKVPLNLESVVFQSIVEETRTTLKPLAEKKGLRLGISVPSDKLVFKTDRRALSQILLNLANNAIKFTEEGEVQIDLRDRTDSGRRVAEISVRDTGIGLKTEDQAKLFQAFTQMGNTGKLRYEGTGLGLHLSQKLAGLLGATITVQSEYGKGSTFTLSMPEK